MVFFSLLYAAPVSDAQGCGLACLSAISAGYHHGLPLRHHARPRRHDEIRHPKRTLPNTTAPARVQAQIKCNTANVHFILIVFIFVWRCGILYTSLLRQRNQRSCNVFAVWGHCWCRPVLVVLSCTCRSQATFNIYPCDGILTIWRKDSLMPVGYQNNVLCECKSTLLEDKLSIRPLSLLSWALT